MNVVNKQSLVNENNRSVVLKVKRRMESIKESIKRIQGAKGYQAFVEKLAIKEQEENKAEITEDTVDNYVKKFTKTTFEESLREVLPLIHRINEEEMEDNRMNQIQSVMSIITAKDKKTGDKMNRIYFPARTDGFDFDKIKKQYADPRSKDEAEEQKKMKLALQIDDLAHRVDVDSKDDKKRKNKGHDRAAELSNFLGDVADDIRNGTNLTQDKLKLAGYLMKLSKTATEGTEVVKQNIEEQFDSMLAEAFDKFEIPA